MPDGRPSAPWCMVQLSSAKPSKNALTSCAVAEKGSPFNFSTEFSPVPPPIPAPMSNGNPGGIMCGGQACMGNAPIGIAAPYMAAAALAAATLAERSTTQPQHKPLRVSPVSTKVEERRGTGCNTYRICKVGACHVNLPQL